MYQVFCDDVKIADSRIDDLAIINPIVTLQANAAGSFSFGIPADHPYYNSIQRLTSVIRVEQDGDIIFQGFCSSETVDFYKNRNIVCDGDLAYLNDSILRPAKYQGETVATLFAKYITQHNSQVEARKQFTVGNVTVTDPNNYIYCFANMNPTMQEIKEDLVDDLGGYLMVRYENGVKYIDYLADSPRTCSQIIELGVNLLDYKSNINESKLATRCIPLGAILEEQTIEGLDTRLDIKSVNSDLDYVESQSAIDSFGIITKTIIFDDVNVASILKTKGEQWLAENQFENIVLEVNAVDFGMLSSSMDSFKLLDKVRVKSAVHGMNRDFILTKIIYNLNQPEKNVYTFGNKTVLALTVQAIQKSKDIEKIANSIDENAWLERAKQEATDLLSGVDGGYVVFNVDETTGKPYEILVMDQPSKETATKVWRWNKNGFGYSDHGYEPEEPFTYKTAITMDGKILADFIGAGTIEGAIIAKNLTMQGGSIDISTTQSNDDRIKLEYINQGHYISAQYDEVYYNNKYVDNEGFRTWIDEEGIWVQTYISEPFTKRTIAYIGVHGTTQRYSNAFGVMTLLDGNGVERVVIRADSQGIRLKDENNKHRLSLLAEGTGQQHVLQAYNSNEDATAWIDSDDGAMCAYYFRDIIYGYAMCGYNTDHTYRIWWSGTQLQIQVDSTWVWDSSDKRLKKNIEEIKDGYINAIGKVNLIQYNQNRELYNDKVLYFGAIVQDIIEALEEEGLTENNLKLISKNKISDEDDTEYYGLDYEQFLLARIAYDEKRIADLEKRLADLEKEG